MAGCPTHPEVEAIGTCFRCGGFYCRPEELEVDGLRYCGACGARADVDWLGHHYRKFEGKRSGLAWFLFFLGLGAAGFAMVALIDMESWRDRVLCRRQSARSSSRSSLRFSGEPHSPAGSSDRPLTNRMTHFRVYMTL